MRMLKKVKYISDIFYVSKLTGVKNKKRKIFLSVTLANIIVFLDIIIILIFASFFDNTVSFNFVLNYLNKNIFLLPVIVIIRFGSIYLERMNIHSLQLDVEKNLRLYLLKEVFEKSNYSISDSYFYVNELSKNISYFYGSLALTLNFLLQLIIYLIYLVFTSFNLIFFFLIGAILLYFPTSKLLVKSRRYVKDGYDYEKITLANIQKVLENMYLIKILDTTNSEIENFKTTIDKFYKSVFKRFKYGAINSLIPNFFTFLVLAILLAFFEISKFLTIEFIGIILRLFQSLGNFNSHLNLVINSHVHIEKLYQLEKNKIKNHNSYFYNKKLEKVVNFNSVDFKYFGQEQNIFSNINLSIPKNKHIVVVGPNGSGKSTFLGLASGVLHATNGFVEISTNKVGYVGPNPLIIEGTIKENILYGNSQSLSDNKIIDLIESVNLFKDKNYDLSLKINNKSLSSGQMQKIGFLRIFASDVDFLILDESMANLDYESKKIISDMLSNKNLSILNSTHDLNLEDFDMKIEISTTDQESKITLF